MLSTLTHCKLDRNYKGGLEMILICDLIKISKMQMQGDLIASYIGIGS